MAKMRSFTAGFPGSGCGAVAPSTSGGKWQVCRASRLIQPQGEGDDLWHWGLLPGWQQWQWQATMPQSAEPGDGRLIPTTVRGNSREQITTAHLM